MFPRWPFFRQVPELFGRERTPRENRLGAFARRLPQILPVSKGFSAHFFSGAKRRWAVARGAAEGKPGEEGGARAGAGKEERLGILGNKKGFFM